MEQKREIKSKSLMKTVKRPTKQPKAKVPKKIKNQFYDVNVKFFTNFVSAHETRKKFGSQRIIQELNRSSDDVQTYGSFFEHPENWVITPVQEMNLLKPNETSFPFEPQCILGIGGQGCVFLGKIGSASYAFKIRSRTHSAISSGTSSSPGRRRSPAFRSGDRGRIQETPMEEDSGKKKRVNFIDDGQQESMHREAVAAFRVYSACNMLPKPLLYGYTGKQSFEVFVMEHMDYTLHDLIRGTTWKTRMGVLGDVWTKFKECYSACETAGVVHFDLKPENVAFKLEPSQVYMGLLDFGITKSHNYSLDKFNKGARIFRPPGTVSFMGPRTHLWKPMGYIDDFLASFFTMYIYGTSEGTNSYDKLTSQTTIRRFRYPVGVEDRKTMTPHEVAIYCLRYPPWSRFPYGSSHPIKNRQNESIVKEEISLGMLKIHSMTSPQNVDDIVSIILNLDGFLDDTMDMQETPNREEYSSLAATFLETFLSKQIPKFAKWWLDFTVECKERLDDLHRKTPEPKKKKNYESVHQILKRNLSAPEEILGLIQESSYGLKLVELDLQP